MMSELTTPSWSEPRKRLASAVASVLYGVIAIMSADIAYEPGRASRYALAVGALLVGFAMALTHLFVNLVEDETHRGSHLESGGLRAILRSSSWVMAFPIVVALLVLAGQFIGLRTGLLADLLPYFSVATVTMLGFGSSYALVGKWAPALARGLSWTMLSLVLFLAKQLAS
jgi:hypothetical protein